MKWPCTRRPRTHHNVPQPRLLKWRPTFDRLEDRLAPSVVPAGFEFRVNTFTTGSQEAPAVATDADGDFVVVWTSNNQTGDNGYGIYGQRYNAAGTPQSAEFHVNTFTTDNQSSPAIAMDADGGFVVVWESSNQDGSGSGIFGQRFNAAGAPQGGEFLVNTFTTNHQIDPAVAKDADGDFVVVWSGFGIGDSSFGIFGQRFNAAGAAQGVEFHVNTFTTNNQLSPAVAMDADGDFVVAWYSDSQAGDSGLGIFGQRFNAAGAAQGVEFHANTFTTNGQSKPAVAMDADGDFAVVWQSFNQTGDDNYGIYGQRFNSAGTPQGAEFHINTFTTNTQNSPTVAMDADGGFAVVWDGIGSGDNIRGIFGQRYTATGTQLAAEFHVNTFTTSQQTSPALAMDADGDFVVAWQSDNQPGDSSFGIYAQRYGHNTLNVSVPGESSPIEPGERLAQAVEDGVTLDAIMAEWTSANPYDTRADNLASMLNAATVFDDFAADTLTGGLGADWFWSFGDAHDQVVGERIN